MMKLLYLPLLHVSRYQIQLKPKEPARLPVFLGSTLRGAFGHALKSTVCIVNHRDCNRCIVAERCVYPYLFEILTNQNNAQNNHQLSHPFVLAPPLLANSRPGDYQQFSLEDKLDFELVLVGRVIDYLPYVVYAISKMAEQGFGLTYRACFQLDSVGYLGDGDPIKMYDSKTEKLVSISNVRTLTDLIQTRLEELLCSISDQITLQFITPTRIRVEGDLQTKLDFSLLIRNLLRRVSLLSQSYGQEKWQQDFSTPLKLAEEVETKANQLQWWDFERYSNRQRTKMRLGGFVGKIEYQGLGIRELLPLLVAGEFLHIGGSTSFGLGKYKIIG
jgi:CRISPR-associated endoribonuclease Cas6